MSKPHEKIHLAIHAALADEQVSSRDRSRIADAACRAFQSAEAGHEILPTTLTGIIKKAMIDSSSMGMCGCMGPRPGEKLCPCAIQGNMIVSEAVSAIETYFAAKLTAQKTGTQKAAGTAPEDSAG